MSFADSFYIKKTDTETVHCSVLHSLKETFKRMRSVLISFNLHKKNFVKGVGNLCTMYSYSNVKRE